MHNLTYSITTSRVNYASSNSVIQKQKIADKRVKVLRNEKEFSTLTTYKIAMQEVFEKHNDQIKTKPFTILNNSNLAYCASKLLLKKRATRFEAFHNQKLIAGIIATALGESVPNLTKTNPKLLFFFEKTDFKFQNPKFNPVSQIETFASTIFFLSELKGKEAILEMTSLSLFKRCFREIDLSKTADNNFVFQVLKMLKILLKVLGKEAVAEFKNYDFIKKIMEDHFEDKKINAYRVYLLPTFLPDPLSILAHASDKTGLLNGGTSLRKHNSSTLPIIANPSAVIPRIENSHQQVARMKTSVPVNFVLDSELTRQKKIMERETCNLLTKDNSFRSLIRPFFELASETNFYHHYVDKTFSNKELVPKTFEQMLTYFPNYQTINELLNKQLPQTSDIEKSTYIIQTLFTQEELLKNVTFENYIERIVNLVQIQDKIYIPYLLQENNYLRYIISEICQNKFVFINLTRTEIRCESISSINDVFFSAIPNSFKQNLRFLFYLHYANRIFSHNLELALSFFQTHPFFESFGLTMNILVRMIVFVKFLQGEKVHTVYDYKVANEIIFKETLKAFSDKNGIEVEPKMKDLYIEFLVSLKRSVRIDFAGYFLKKNENKVQGYNENLGNYLMRSNPKSTILMNTPVNFLTHPPDNFSVQNLKGLIDKKVRYDYKKLLAFKKQFKTELKSEFFELRVKKY